MSDGTDAVRRRTVLQRAAVGFGASLAVGVAATGEAAAALCVEATSDSQTYHDSCPLGDEAFTVSEGDEGVPVTDCSAADGTAYVLVDWDAYSTDTWIDSANIDSVPC